MSIQSIRRKYLYGITQEEFDRKYQEQGGLCAICRVNPATSVDHNHETGENRGLLCGNCNRGLGLFRELIANFESAIAYLYKWNDRAVQVEPNTGRRMDGRE